MSLRACLSPVSRPALHISRNLRVAPEWGSGGIYGLLAARWGAVFTLSFEGVIVAVKCGSRGLERLAEANLSSLEGAPGFRAVGGDTYNAKTLVDGIAFLGGWAHFFGEDSFRATLSERRLDFASKYSYLAVWDPYSWSGWIAWIEGPGSGDTWPGEVSEVVYNPVRDSLLLARGDGHFSLGVYEADTPRRKGERVKPRLVDGFRPLKGTYALDLACFSAHRGWGGPPSISCYDSATLKPAFRGESSSAVDGHSVKYYRSGPLMHLGASIYLAHRGGLTVFDPQGGLKPLTYRLLDFPGSTYGPLRVNAEPVMGGYLIPFTFSAYTVRGGDYPPEIYERGRALAAPTVILFLYHRGVRVAGIAGYRVTSIASRGGELAIAWNSEPNLERRDLVLAEHGEKGIDVVDVEALLVSRPPPLRISFRPREGEAFGGIPLEGYGDASITAKGCRGGTLKIYYYDLASEFADVEKYSLNEWNDRARVPLDTSSGVASFLVEGCKALTITIHAR